jgi:hypothetical protein
MKTQASELRNDQTPLAAQAGRPRESAEQIPHGPRVTAGRTVYYVLADGQVRPLIVTRIYGDANGHVNGVLYFDGTNDATLLPRPHTNPAEEPCMYLSMVPYNVSKIPNTWHWPEEV